MFAFWDGRQGGNRAPVMERRNDVDLRMAGHNALRSSTTGRGRSKQHSGVEHVTTLLRHGSATGVTRHLATSLLDLLAVGAVYFVLAKIGLTLASINSSTSAIWPATGFALRPC